MTTILVKQGATCGNADQEIERRIRAGLRRVHCPLMNHSGSGYGAARRNIVLYGGEGSQDTYDNTWVRDGTRWLAR